jgi:hypothetical protein
MRSINLAHAEIKEERTAAGGGTFLPKYGTTKELKPKQYNLSKAA